MQNRRPDDGANRTLWSMWIGSRLILLACILLCRTGFGATNSLAELRNTFQEIAKAADGRVGAAVELLETKEAVSLNGQEHFPMQSVYKFPIAMAVLREVDKGTLRLEQPIRFTTNDLIAKWQHSPVRDAHPLGGEVTVSNLLHQMVSESDGTACDIFLRLLGLDTVNEYLHGLRVTNVIVATTEKEMGRGDERAQYRNWSTPEGMVGLLRALHEGRGLSAHSRKLLLEFMTGSPTGPKRIKGLLPAGTRVAHKTGSSRTVDGLTAATNDAGIITLPDGRHLAVVVFVSDSRADDASRDAVIAKMSEAAWEYWTNLTEGP